MWKLIILLVLVIYLLNKISVFLFRMAGRPRPTNFGRTEPNDRADTAQKPPKGSRLKGGDYVDYEEVK